MAKLSAHGAELLRVEHADCRVAYTDFMYTLLPDCRLTDERKAILLAAINQLELDDEECFQITGGDEDATVQQAREFLVDWDFKKNRPKPSSLRQIRRYVSVKLAAKKLLSLAVHAVASVPS